MSTPHAGATLHRWSILVLAASGAAALDVFAPGDLRTHPDPDRDPIGQAVWLDGFWIDPRRRMDAGDDRLDLHPFALASVGASSNPRRNSDHGPASDVERGVAGFELRLHQAPTTSARLRALGDARTFTALGDRDREAEVLAEIDHRGQALELGAGAGGAVVERFDRSGFRPTRYDTANVFAGGRSVGAVTSWGLRGDAAVFDHKDREGDGIEAERRDRAGFSLAVDAARRTGADLELRANARIAHTRYAEDELFQSWSGGAATVGGTWDWGSRSWLDLMAGLEQRTHRDHFARDPAWGDAAVMRPTWAGDVRWGWRSLRYLGLETVAALEDSDLSNDRWRTHVRLYHRGGMWQDRLVFLSWLGWERYAECGGDPAEVRQNLTFDLRMPYDLGDGLQLRPELHAVKSTARYGADFLEVWGSLGVAAVW